MKTPYSAEFRMAPQEMQMQMQMDRVQQAAGIIENCCELRMELYKELSERP